MANDKTGKESQSAERVVADLLAWASHELRTPAASIGGYADILAMGARGQLTPQQLELVERIKQAQTHLVALLDDIVTFTKTTSGRITFDISDAPLGPIVERVLSIAEPLASARELRLDAADIDGVVVRADSERVLQILLNLVMNSVKFTPAQGTVGVTCKRVDGTVSVVVRDSGRGIPAEARERIFKPYVQLGKPSAAGNRGVGLGLAISRELARSMGGDLYYSDSPDGETAFTLQLPAG